MIKNVILFFLAICFILLILSYILNINQLKLWNSSLIEGANDGSSINSVLAANAPGRVSYEQIEAIEKTLLMHNNIESGVNSKNLIEILVRLQVQDEGFLAILNDETKTDFTRLSELKYYVQTKLKTKLSADGLILHYTLDEIQGQTVKNIAEETSGESKYDGTIHGKTYVDTSDYKYGNGSMRFRYDQSQRGNQSDYIQIQDIPLTFYKDDIFQGFTFATWYLTTSNSKPYARLFEFATGGGGTHTMHACVSWDNTTMSYHFMIYGPDEYEFNLCKIDATLPTHQWIHIATTISQNGSYTNYINGVVAKSNYSINKSGSPSDLKSIVWGGVVDPETKALRVPANVERKVNYIGKSAWSNWDGGFDGRMNDFRIYRKALSASDILGIYNLKNPDVKYTFTGLTTQINAKRENVVLNKDSTIQLVKDVSGKNKVGYARGYLPYCPTNQVITIPVGQHLEITKNIENKEFTMAIVINVYDFNSWSFTDKWYGYNRIIGGSCTTFEMFYHANHIYISTSCTNGYIPYNVGHYLNHIKGDSINIYIVKMDSNQNITLSINGILCINQQMPAHDNWKSGNICIGKGPSDNHWSQNPIDLYEFMHLDEFYSLDKQQYMEGYLAKKWGLNVLPANHPYRNM